MRPDERRELVAVAARAFWHDPLLDFFARDLLHEHRVLPSGFRAYIADLSAPGAEVWVGEHHGRPRALAGWFPPGSYPRPRLVEALSMARLVPVVARCRHRRRALRLFAEVDRRHLREPHWYLSLLATDPTAQGHGIGTALLEPVLTRCDRDAVPAYTETQKEANLAWYARSGFSVTDEVRLPGTPPVWCLRREPKTT